MIMKSRPLLLFIILFTLAINCYGSAKNFYVKDYGAQTNGVSDDGPAIRKAIYSAIKCLEPARVIFEGNKIYKVKERPDCWESFDIINAKDLTIEGNGSTLLISPKAFGFILENCDNTVVKGFDIDYDPLPFTQGEVCSIDREKGFFNIKIQDGFPEPPTQKWMEDNYLSHGRNGWRFGVNFSSSKSNVWKGVKGIGHIMIDEVNRVAPKEYQVKVRPDYIQLIDFQIMQPGDQFVIRVYYSTWDRIEKLKGLPVANFRLVNNKNCKLENIRQYSSPCMSISLTDNRGRITIDNYNIMLKPGTKRLLASLSDGIHCKNNEIGPIIENCFFQGLADDSINISVMAEVVQKIISPKSLLVKSSAIVWYIHPVYKGDVMQVLDPVTGKEIARAEVESVEYREGHLRILNFKEPLSGIVAENGGDDKNATMMFNLSRCGNGYIIRNNKFQYQTRNAMLLRASGLVENNTIMDVGGHGIWAGNCLQFLEGPIPENITIRNNRISNCQNNTGIVLAFDAYRPTKLMPINNIIVQDNIIENFGYGGGISISNARNIKLTNNTLRADMTFPFKSNRYWPAIIIKDCQEVKIEGGSIVDTRRDVKAGIEIECRNPKKSVVVSGIEFDLPFVPYPVRYISVSEKN